MKTNKQGLKVKVGRKSPDSGKFSLPREPKLGKKEPLEINRSWTIEAGRRLRAFRAGRIKAIPHRQVMQDVYRVVKRMEIERSKTAK